MKSFRDKLAKIPKEALPEIAKAIEAAARETIDRQFAQGVGPQGKKFAPLVSGKASNLGGHREWIRIESRGSNGFVVRSTSPAVLWNMVRANRKKKGGGFRQAAPGRPLMPYPKRLPALWSRAFRAAVTRATNEFLKRIGKPSKRGAGGRFVKA